MDKIVVTGGTPLKGRIEIGGAKNAALPLMAACLLSEEPLELSNVPFLSDITTMANLLSHHGVEISIESHTKEDSTYGRTMILDAGNITDLTAPYEIVRKMRASVVVLGPLLARFGECKVSLPGGCAIGTRPIDYHLSALETLGAEIILEEGYVLAKAPNGLIGAEVNFPEVSVGATENIMMAACLAKGTTILHNAAREPEVTDLAECLIAMGAKMEGVGTSTLTIHGVEKLGAAHHKVISDRIEAGSFAIAAAMTGGELELIDPPTHVMQSTLDALEKAGVEITETKDGLLVKGNSEIQPLTLETAPHPGFATDMQAQFVAMLALAKGDSFVTETIFENRFMHVPELQRMGANIEQRRRNLVIHGIEEYTAAEVMATDLRASISMVLAALAAEGETIINRVYHIDRGYERVEEKLSAVGANIKRVHE